MIKNQFFSDLINLYIDFYIFDIIMSKSVDDYIAWYDEQYFDIIQLDKLKNKAKNDKISWLVDAINKFSIRDSSVWRFESISTMLYGIPIRKTEYISTPLTVTGVIDGQPFSLKYGFIISYIVRKLDDFTVTHEYYTACPTYKSCDGEYRKGLLPIKQLEIIKSIFAEHFAIIEPHIISELNRKNISFSHSSFIPRDETNAESICAKISESIQDNRLDITIYMQFLFANILSILLVEARGSSHITENFWKIIELHKPITDYICDSQKSISHYTYRYLTHIKPHESIKFCPTSCGFKIIPLTVTDVEHIYDIRLDPWREIYIMSKLSKLLVNGVCQTFPFLSNWSIFQNISKDIFDNKINHVKFDHSKIALNMVRDLEKVRSNTYFMDPTSKNEVYYSYGMRGFSDAIKTPISYAEREIIMSGYGLCVFQEHVGTTAASLTNNIFAQTSQKYNSRALYDNYPLFCKFLFEQLYGLHCMNTRLGIVHGDLHLNNVTYHRNGTPTFQVCDRIRLSTFEVDGKFYSFPSYNCISCIIDFSRSFIWNRKILSQDFDKKQMREIKLDIKYRLLRVLENELPDFTRPRLYDIEFSMKKHFDLVYDIFKAVDCHRLMGCHEQLIIYVSNTFSDRPDIIGEKKDMMDKILPFVKKLKQTAYNFITTYIEKLINLDKNSSLTIPEFNKLVLTSMFEEFSVDRYKPETNSSVINFASDSNPLKYSIEKYEQLPELLKLEYSIAHNIESDSPKIQKRKEYMEYLESHDTEKNIQHIVDTIKTEQNERRGINTTKNSSENELIFD